METCTTGFHPSYEVQVGLERLGKKLPLAQLQETSGEKQGGAVPPTGTNPVDGAISMRACSLWLHTGGAEISHRRREMVETELGASPREWPLWERDAEALTAPRSGLSHSSAGQHAAPQCLLAD